MPPITRLTNEHLLEAAAFVARLQAEPSRHIGYFGEEVGEIVDAIGEWTDPTNCLLLYETEHITGFIGVDYDTTDIKRAWIHGPLVENWDTHADLLYTTALEQLIPAEITSYELYGDAVNSNLAQLAERHGYKGLLGAALLSISRNQAVQLPEVQVDELSVEQYDVFKRLHDTIFPKTYYSGRQIIDLIDATHRVFVTTENDQLLGYLYATVHTETEGYIDFLGVAESDRRRGIGKQLITAATHWLFTFDAIKTVALTVNDDNHAAIALYQQIGYTHARTLKAFRKFL